MEQEQELLIPGFGWIKTSTLKKTNGKMICPYYIVKPEGLYKGTCTRREKYKKTKRVPGMRKSVLVFDYDPARYHCCICDRESGHLFPDFVECPVFKGEKI